MRLRNLEIFSMRYSSLPNVEAIWKKEEFAISLFASIDFKSIFHVLTECQCREWPRSSNNVDLKERHRGTQSYWVQYQVHGQFTVMTLRSFMLSLEGNQPLPSCFLPFFPQKYAHKNILLLPFSYLEIGHICSFTHR